MLGESVYRAQIEHGETAYKQVPWIDTEFARNLDFVLILGTRKSVRVP